VAAPGGLRQRLVGRRRGAPPVQELAGRRAGGRRAGGRAVPLAVKHGASRAFSHSSRARDRRAAASRRSPTGPRRTHSAARGAQRGAAPDAVPAPPHSPPMASPALLAALVGSLRREIALAMRPGALVAGGASIAGRPASSRGLSSSADSGRCVEGVALRWRRGGLRGCPCAGVWAWPVLRRSPLAARRSPRARPSPPAPAPAPAPQQQRQQQPVAAPAAGAAVPDTHAAQWAAEGRRRTLLSAGRPHPVRCQRRPRAGAAAGRCPAAAWHAQQPMPA
jgi:hypothetical protein